MKKYQQYFNVLVTLALCLLVFMQVQPKGREAMSVEFDGTDLDQCIDYGALSAVQNLATKSICFWV